MHKKIITLILSILCCYPLVSGNEPNVVLIISDDAGYADFGFMNEVTGNTTDILTPELDTLRSQGSSLSERCALRSTSRLSLISRGGPGSESQTRGTARRENEIRWLQNLSNWQMARWSSGRHFKRRR